MMGKERELLVRCRAAINIRYDQVMLIRLRLEIETLLGEVEELLDQPEQEPVAWMQDSIELYVLEEKNILRGYVIPLYTSPPVSDITGEELMKQVKTNRVFYQEGYAQAELDLKREPLSDEEVIAKYRAIVAKMSYVLADAMLAEREKNEN
jgi:hypothetical protein